MGSICKCKQILCTVHNSFFSLALVKCIWQRFIVYGQQRIVIVRSFWPLYFLNRWAKSSGIVMVKFIRRNHHHFSTVFYTCFFTGGAQNNKFFVLCHFFSFDENPEFKVQIFWESHKNLFWTYYYRKALWSAASRCLD